MVDCGSQRNPTLAGAIGAGFAARTTVCYSLAVRAGIKRAAGLSRADYNSHCPSRALDPREAGTRQDERRQTPGSSTNSVTISLDSDAVCYRTAAAIQRPKSTAIRTIPSDDRTRVESDIA